MAETKEAVCNLALAHLGDPGKLTEATLAAGSSKQDLLCSRFFSIAMDIALTRHNWKFATRKAALTEHDTTDDAELNLNGEWGFAYDSPPCMLRPLKVLPLGAPKSRPSEDYTTAVAELEDDGDKFTLILTNLSEAYIDYIIREDDVSRWPSDFLLAVSYQLAALIAPALVSGKVGIALKQACEASYVKYLNDAIANDANKERVSDPYRDHKPSWISNR